jgi:hypothetical protein
MALSQQDFVTTFGPLADDISSATGLDRSVVLGQIANETGWGNHYVGNNIFGISPGGKLASYASIGDAARDYIRLINGPRYVMASTLPADQQATAIHQSGYATDPNYGGKVTMAAKAVRNISDQSTPSADDLLERMRKLAPGGAQNGAGSGAAPSTGGAAPAASNGTAAPSTDDLLERMRAIAPPPVERAPQLAPGGPPPGEQIGVYSKAGQVADNLPGRPRRPYVPPTPSGPPSDTEPSPAKGPVENILAAGAAGYRDTPPILTYEAREAANKTWLGRNLLNPILDTGSTILADLGAVGGAIGQGAYELGNALGGPSLGRDLYAGSQVVPVVTAAIPGATFAGQPRGVPEPPRPGAAPRFVSGVADVSPEAQVRAATHPSGPSEPIPSQSTEPQSVGAASSREGTSASNLTMTPEEATKARVANLEKTVSQSAEDRAGPRMQDDTRYVEGIPDRTLAGQDFSDSQHALDEKVRSAKNPEFRNKVDEINRARNQGMVDLLAADAKDSTALDAAHATRSLVSPDQMGVFDKERPTNFSKILAAVDEDLKGRGGKRDAVRAVLTKVRNSLFDVDGNLETSPSLGYGVRENITDMLKKSVKGTGDEADAIRAVKAKLQSYLPLLDDAITEGAPLFKDYLRAWHELSQPIDRMEFLQQYQPGGTKKLVDGNGYLRPAAVQRMLEDILRDTKASGPKAAKSLTDQEINNIIAVRNELATRALQDRLGSVRGSDTFQQIERAGQPGPVGNALRATAHTAGIISTGGVANLLYEHGVKPGFAARRNARIARQTTERENQLLGGIPPQR